jgi:TRAP-type C4-dicarboxylate transport system substrate-binding protein
VKRAVLLAVPMAAALAFGILALVAFTSGGNTDASSATSSVEDVGQIWELDLSFGFSEEASLYAAHVVPWSKAVEAATDGRVRIKYFGSGALAKDDQQYDAVLSGTCDIAVVEPEYTGGAFPIFEVGSMPLMFPDPAVATASMWDLYENYCDVEFGSVVVVGVTCISGGQYVGTKKVVVPRDLAGMKMRSGGKVEDWILEELGGEPVDIMVGDLAPSMEKGLADGAFLTWSYIMAVGVKDYTSYRTHLDLMYRPWVMVMNKDVWNTMPVDIQEAIMSVSTREDSITYAVVNEEITRKARTQLESFDKGVGNGPVCEPTDKDMKQWRLALTEVWDTWAAGLKASKGPHADEGQKILTFLEEKRAEYEGIYETHLDAARKILGAIDGQAYLQDAETSRL